MNFEKFCKMMLILFCIFWGVGTIDFLNDLWKCQNCPKRELSARGIVLILAGCCGVIAIKSLFV